MSARAESGRSGRATQWAVVRERQAARADVFAVVEAERWCVWSNRVEIYIDIGECRSSCVIEDLDPGPEAR